MLKEVCAIVFGKTIVYTSEGEGIGEITDYVLPHQLGSAQSRLDVSSGRMRLWSESEPCGFVTES